MPQLHDSRDQEIRKSAYRLWVQAGRPLGEEEEYFRIAKSRFPDPAPPVLNDDLDIAGTHSFPASDPVNHT